MRAPIIAPMPGPLNTTLCLWALPVVCTLAGCAAAPGPAPVKPEVVLPAAFSAPAAGPAVDLRSWWRSFGDPALDALVQQALAGSPDVQVAAARLRGARALAGAATARWQPRLALSGTSQPTNDGRGGYFQGGFDAQWELPLFGRAEAAQGVAAAELQSAAIDSEAARASLVAEVARTYLELRGAEREQALLQSQAVVATERLRVVQQLQRAQQVAGAEVTTARLALAQAEGARVEPAAQAARLRLRLQVLLGDLQAVLPPPRRQAEPPALPTAPAAGLPAELLTRRADIRRAEQQLIRAAHTVGLARADAQGHVSLGGLLGFTAGLSGPAAGVLRATLALGPSFSIPLWDHGERAAQVQAREAEFEAATAQYRQAVLEGVADVQAAWLQWSQAQERAASAATVLALQQQRAAAAQARRNIGLDDALPTTDAQAALLQAQQERGAAVLAAQLAQVALFKALGGAPKEATP